MSGSEARSGKRDPIQKRGPIQKVGLCLKPASQAAGDAARDLRTWLAGRGIEVLLDAEAGERLGGPGLSREALAQRADLLVVLGGDGTLLAVAREAGPVSVPILGVNLGALGFLAEVSPEDLEGALERVLGGELETVARMRMEVETLREGVSLGRYLALNDVVITRSDLSRVIDIEAWTDGSPVATYHGDGLIVATPTGSTAYSLSAGGPILHPALDAMVLTPICPHTLTQRPIVLAGGSRIEMRVAAPRGAAQLTVDGQAGLPLEPGDRVGVTRSAHSAHFVVSPFRSRFDVLRAKLRWGAD
jgi:NAD+ kinase